eukprot:6045488-Ditylum_brightwellii.AAC.2
MDQKTAKTLAHTTREAIKWQGTLRLDSMIGTTTGTPPQQTAGHLVIEELLECNVHILLGTIDPFGKEAPGLQWLRHSNKRKPLFDTTLHHFGRA